MDEKVTQDMVVKIVKEEIAKLTTPRDGVDGIVDYDIVKSMVHDTINEVLTMDETNKRTRMNVSLTAKGLAQWDVTSEYDTPEATAENLSKAIDLCREVIKNKGLTEAGANS